MGERAVFRWAFDAMAGHRIKAQVHPHNAPSLTLLERLGSLKTGYCARPLLVRSANAATS